MGDCNLCGKPLGKDRVRDHDHLTGQYRGALHFLCNLKYRLSKKIPVVFHNLKHYDAHLIMQGLGKIEDHELHVIPNNMEKYITFSISNKVNDIRVSLQFIDSFQFLGTSLEKLVLNLPSAKFNILRENITRGDADLLLRKGVYPYDYIQSVEMFDETCLPPPAAFFNSLTEEDVSEDDYRHAQNVWSSFQLNTMGEYHDLYVKSDVLLLADVFQNFRKLCLQFYQLDCAHLMTAPGLSWQACLKMVDQPLELLTDVNMHLLIEEGIRGGISVITQRYARANNPYLNNWNESEPSSYIMYLDANNLYGWAMSQYLPYANFEWMSVEGVNSEWISSLSDESEEGYILEVDLDYPPELHDTHNDYPLAPEKLQIHLEDLSPFSAQNLPHAFHSSTKLIPNLKNKKNYVVYYRNLKFYLKHGLTLTKVHKIIKFSQKPWLKEYIDFNTEQRKKATSSFQKDFFKLLNNSVYGKMIENVRKRVDVQLVNTEKRAQKLVAAPTFKEFKIFDHGLVAVKRLKASLVLNRPIYVGFVILEVSKLLMYDFHYNTIQREYGGNASLLFTDTDSLTYAIKTRNIYEDMEKYAHIFDTSDYPQDHPLYSVTNKKRIGCFKDELNAKPVVEFIGLRPKMYSILSEEGEKKTAKGVSRHVVQKNIRHSDYKSCLQNMEATRVKQVRIQSDLHHLYTVQQSKTGLSPFDDKRYILEDGVHTLAYGHYRISSP